MPIITVENLSKHYRVVQKEEGLKGSFRSFMARQFVDNRAVDAVGFTLNEGEFVGFLGPNGAGKTTTLKLLAGLLHPTSGWATVMGYTPWERKNEFRSRYSLVMGQKNQLWWDLPAIESFNLNKEIYQIPNAQYKATLDELTDLLEVRPLLYIQVRRLSLGERMKLELIASLLHNPEVLFLDEPTIGLDLISQKKIRDFLVEYNKSYHTTILLTSHYMDDIQALCKRVIIINRGRKVYDGQLSEIIQEFSAEKEITAIFATPVTEADIIQIAPYKEFDPLKVTFRVKRAELTGVVFKLLQKYQVTDLNTTEVELEAIITQVFMQTREAVG